jgi:hypothetical protein
MFATYVLGTNRDVPGVGRKVTWMAAGRGNKTGHPMPITWAGAVTVVATLGLGFAFELLLIVLAGVDYRVATAITLALIVAVVSSLLPGCGRGVWRRLAIALQAFLRAGPD